MSYKQLLEEILKAIVGNPEKVRITEVLDAMGVLLTVDADKEDLRFIIGKQGAMVNAIRTIIRTVGMKEKANVHISINDSAFVSTSTNTLRQTLKTVQ